MILLVVGAPAAGATWLHAAPDPPADGVSVVPQPSDEATTELNGEIDLSQLVDLCAKRSGFTVEYEPTDLAGRITVREASAVTDAELWALTNELLAARGLASIQRPGTRILSVVRKEKAREATRVTAEGIDATSLASFQSVLLRVRHRDAKTLVESLRTALGRETASASAVGDGGLIVVTDYVERIREWMAILAMVDVPEPGLAVETVRLRHVRAQELIASAMTMVAAREEPGAKKLRGRPTAVSESTIVLVAPEEDLPTWRSILEALDAPPDARTETYAVRGFGIGDVAKLVESSCRDPGPQGSGARWKVVVDDLTTTLLVTATPSEHTAIDALFERLASAPQDARQQVRTFVVRNRAVKEVVDVLAGILDASPGADDAEPRADVGGGTRAPGGSSPGSGGAPASANTIRPADSSVVLSTPLSTTPRSPTPGLSAPGSRSDPGRSPSGASPSSGAVTISRKNLTITTDEGTNSLIVSAEPRVITRIESLLKSIDVRQSQVMIEALVLSLTDDESLDLGVELSKLEISGSTIASLSSLFGLSKLAASSTNMPAAGNGGTGAVLRPGDFSILVRALETVSKGKTLNLPKVLVSNNKQAALTSVLQQPVLSTNASSTVATTSFSGTQDAGTVVTVTPQIAEGDHLLLDYSVEISSFVGDSADPSLPPPRQQNQLKSVVAIPDGYVVAVGGLRIEGDVQGVSQVPLLGDIPIVGEAFKSRSNTRTRSRFYVFIRANILRQGGFEDLKYLSDVATAEAGIDDGFPANEPRVIK